MATTVRGAAKRRSGAYDWDAEMAALNERTRALARRHGLASH